MGTMIGGLIGIGSYRGSASLAAMALAILQSYGTNAHIYIPGVGAVNGITAGNYLYAHGVSPATVDGVVGETYDAIQASTLGAELCTNTNYDTGLGSTTSPILAGNTVFWDEPNKRAVLQVLQTTGFPQIYVRNTPVGGFVGGKTYRVRLTITNLTYAENLNRVYLTTNQSPSFSLSTEIPVGTSATVEADMYYSGANVAYAIIVQLNGCGVFGDLIAIDDVSYKEIPGIQLIQATTANKPLLRLTADKYSWQFDGVNDLLSCGISPWALADDHCVVSCQNMTAGTAVNLAAFGIGNSCAGLISADRVSWHDGTTLVPIISDLTGLHVTSGRRVGDNLIARRDAVSIGTASAATLVGTPILNTSFIGTTRDFNYFAGHMYCVIGIKGTVSDTDLAILEKFAGAFGGVTL